MFPMEFGGIGNHATYYLTVRHPTAANTGSNKSYLRDPGSLDLRSIFFTSFPVCCFPMELGGIGTNHTTTMSCQANPGARLEYRIKRSISLDPNVGSRSDFFHEFLEAVSHEVAWNRGRHVATTTSWRGVHRQDQRVLDQKVPYL
ncbi:hypothetical protein D5086_005883 [Populus alba]|uniref:Uncharacterized protein n=1 Tax=Populus alba TaxID=43335 RepID=A0ACC4CWL4_POPAL